MISSKDNNYIKEIKKLHRKKYRNLNERFIVEGIKMVEEAHEEGLLEEIIYSPRLSDIRKGEETLEAISSFEKKKEVTDEIFNYISDTETPQGIMGICKISKNDIEDLKRERKKNLIMIDGLQDPGNLGTIIRSADAFKMDGILIGENTVDPFNLKVVRSTMGSILRVPIYYLKDNDELDKLKSLGYRIIITDLEGKVDIDKINYDETIIVIGNESRGVSNKVKEKSDEKIKIKMPGDSESLNAAIAASIVMYEVSKSCVL